MLWECCKLHISNIKKIYNNRINCGSLWIIVWFYYLNLYIEKNATLKKITLKKIKDVPYFKTINRWRTYR